MLPQLKEMDDKWRGYLLTLARVPKDALDLKQRILAGLQHQLPQGKRMEALINQLKSRDAYGYWQEFDVQNLGFGAHNELKALIVKNLYLVHANRSFDLIASDSQDLIAAEELTASISALLSPLDLDGNAEIFFQYKTQLDKSLKILAEMLARNTVKTHAKCPIQLAKMQYLGLEMDYMDQHDLKMEILKPAVTVILGLLVVNLVVVSLGLLLFDSFKITPPSHMESWFDLSRALRWSLGSWISLTVAIFFGCFFHETLTKQSEAATPLAYFLAFFFSTLGSGLYFLASRANFSAAHIWLAISFGLIALVTMKSGAIRKSPRIPYHKRIAGQLNNIQTEMLVKDISYGGALVRFPEGQIPAAGQALVLDFDFSPVPGVIIWAEDSLARLRFDTTAPAVAQLKMRLQDSIPADYLLVMAA